MDYFYSIHDKSGKFLDVSPEFEKITGWNLESVKHADIYLFFHKNDRSRIYSMSHVKTPYGITEIKYRLETKSKDFIWVKAISYSYTKANCGIDNCGDRIVALTIKLKWYEILSFKIKKNI